MQMLSTKQKVCVTGSISSIRQMESHAHLSLLRFGADAATDVHNATAAHVGWRGGGKTGQYLCVWCDDRVGALKIQLRERGLRAELGRK